jgi:hypothetical protein
MLTFRAIFVTLFLGGFISCVKVEGYDPVPYIEFISFEKQTNQLGKDETGVLTLAFTDGDGDLGLHDNDTLLPFNPGSKYYYNFYIDFYEKELGAYIKKTLYPENHQRIPYLTPRGQNKALKGTLDISLFINNPFSENDTVMFEFYIIDRALNYSNIIRSPDIVVNK